MSIVTGRMLQNAHSSSRLVQSLWAWFFILVIVFRFVPVTAVSKPVSAVWNAAIGNPISMLPSRGRLALAWAGALGITFGTAFGISRPEVCHSTLKLSRFIPIPFSSREPY